MNYIQKARSNYFFVKDEDKFEEMMTSFDGISLSKLSDGSLALLSDEDTAWTGVDEDGESIDLRELVSPHLREGEVAIFMEIGWEGNKVRRGPLFVAIVVADVVAVAINLRDPTFIISRPTPPTALDNRAPDERTGLRNGVSCCQDLRRGNRTKGINHFVQVLKTVARVMGQGAQDNPLEPLVHLPHAFRQGIDNWPFAGEKFVEHDADRVNIGSVIDLAGSSLLFRCHVCRRAQALICPGLHGIIDFCQAKIRDLHAAPTVDQNVLGLDVAMYDALGRAVSELRAVPWLYSD
jgi:hypothetical protein